MRAWMSTALGAGVMLTTLAASRFGGWAVVSVENPPEYLVVGKPLTLSFAIRQHGSTPMSGLKPTIAAKAGLRSVDGRAWETSTEGVYRATITVPTAGEWRITIDPDFGPMKGKLLPLQAIASASPAPPALAASERGRQLFAAKGCVGCHVHSAVDVRPPMKDAAPDLTDRRFASDYLTKFLADPSIKSPVPTAVFRSMPNPHLKQPEIAALVAFINSERQVSRR